MNLGLPSPEAQLVLLCAGGPENDAPIRALAKGEISWRKVALLANLERAVPVVWHRLRGLGARAEPAEGIAALAPAARVWEFRMLRLERLLGRLLQQLEQAGIDALLLKGAGLAATLYSSFTSRPMWDIDLLVRSEEAVSAWLLARQGDWRWNQNGFPREVYAHHHHLPPLEDRAGSGVRLEIHTSPFPQSHPEKLDPQGFWQDAAVTDWSGLRVRTPSLTHQVIHACVHFAWAHRLSDKAWRTFHDIWAFSESDDVPWDRVTEAARAARVDACCYWTLRLASSAARIRVPTAALEACRPRWPEALLAALERHHSLNMLPLEANCPSSALRDWLWSLSVLKSLIGPSRPHAKPGTDHSPEAEEPPGRLARLGHHLREHEAWLRYVRALSGRLET